MATAPMMPTPAGPAADPAMGGAAPAAPAKKVCIEQAADGSLSVGIEPEGADTGMPEGGQADMADDKSYLQPAGSIDEALDMARQLLQDDGKSPEESALAGYNKSPRQMPGTMGPGKVFGEGM